MECTNNKLSIINQKESKSMTNGEIENFEYIFLKNDGFQTTPGNRLRNDIIVLNFKNGSKIARMYLNNSPEYVDIPYDEVMLNEISHITWTKDSKHTNGTFIKSESDEKNLSDVLKRHGFEYKYYLYKIEDEEISAIEKLIKRKTFINNNPNANSANPLNN